MGIPGTQQTEVTGTIASIAASIANEYLRPFNIWMPPQMSIGAAAIDRRLTSGK